MRKTEPPADSYFLRGPSCPWRLPVSSSIVERHLDVTSVRKKGLCWTRQRRTIIHIWRDRWSSPCSVRRRTHRIHKLKKRFEEALFVRPQVSAARLPGFRRAKRWKKGFRKILRAQAREYLRTASPQHAGNPHRLALRRVWSPPAESDPSCRTMSQVQLRPARLQTVRTLRPLVPLRMQSAHPCENLSQRQTQRLPLVLHPRDDRKRNIQQ